LYFYPVGGGIYWLVLVAALVLVGLLWLGPASGRLSGRRRAALVGLRLGVVLLVLLAMLRPTLVYVKTALQSATLVVLADKSRSMSVPDEVNGSTRYEALQRALDEAAGPLAELAGKFEVKAFAFDAVAQPVELDDGRIALPEVPDGRQTAIGSVLDDVLREEASKRLLGVILLSDGAQRAEPPRDELPQTVAARLAHVAPLYTFRIGKSRGLGQAQDVAVADLVADPQVFVKNELTVSAQVRVDGYANRTIPVQLLVENAKGEMEAVDQQNVEVTSGGQLIPVHFSYVPEMAGEIKIAVEAVGQPGELVGTNNRLSTFVQVLKGGLNVLYLESFPPRVEQKYLRWALDASADINVRMVTLNPQKPDERPADWDEPFAPGKYDAYILGDVDSSLLTSGELTQLADTVAGGAGLMMLGGFQTFGAGGYAGTPLDRVLPVEMEANQRQRPEDPPRSDLHLPGPVKMAPTQIGLGHFALQLGGTRQETEDAWSRLPPLEGANRFDRLKPAARVLATTPDGKPLLADQVYGRGRVMAFAGDSTWRWWMRGNQSAHKRFWRQVILWLSGKERQEGSVWIRLRQRRFRPGASVEFSVGAQSASGEPTPGAQFKAAVVTPGDTQKPVDLVASDGQTTGVFRETGAGGDYTIQVTATQGGQSLGQPEARFVVFEQDLELDHAVADATLLESLAAITGGDSMAPEELSGLIEHLNEKTENFEVQTETKKTLWDTWALLLILVGLLGTEWYLRKRWGLV
jgi:uncharacterized membrane protein